MSRMEPPRHVRQPGKSSMHAAGNSERQGAERNGVAGGINQQERCEQIAGLRDPGAALAALALTLACCSDPEPAGVAMPGGSERIGVG